MLGTTSYLVPNTIRNWHEYAEAEPEFQKLPKSKKPQLEKIKWVKEEIEHQRIIIGTPCLYVNAYSHYSDTQE